MRAENKNRVPSKVRKLERNTDQLIKATETVIIFNDSICSLFILENVEE